MADGDTINAPRLWDDGLVHYTHCYSSSAAEGNYFWIRVCTRSAKNWLFEIREYVTCFECLMKEDEWYL